MKSMLATNGGQIEVEILNTHAYAYRSARLHALSRRYDYSHRLMTGSALLYITQLTPIPAPVHIHALSRN